MLDRLKERLGSVDAVTAARYLLLAELLFLFVSTSLAVVAELLLFLVFLVFPSLRRRVAELVRQPMIFMAIAWAVVLTLGLLYSIGPGAENLDIWKSWRKLLLLPMAAAVFDSEEWKKKFVWTFLCAVAAGLLVSFGSWLLELPLLKREPVPGIVIHNHATQGMLFAAGFFAAVLAWRFLPPRSRLAKGLLLAIIPGVFLNIVFITTGRSGYLVFLVFSGLLPIFLLRGLPRYLFMLAVPLAIGALLFFSPAASQRILQGVDEMQNYAQDAKLTSMGIRMMMWKNTVALIKDRPVFGHGTGGFREAYRLQVEGREGWQYQVVNDPHNQFMRILAEQGLAGLLVFALFLVAFFRQGCGVPWSYLGIGVILAWCASSLFSAHFSTFVEGRFVWLWCGALLGVTAGGEKKGGGISLS